MAVAVLRESLTFPEMLERLHAEKHTGPVVVHLLHGRPDVIEIPQTPERIKLDKGGERA